MENAPFFFLIAPWMVCLCTAWAIRDNAHGPPPAPQPIDRRKIQVLCMGLFLVLGCGFFVASHLLQGHIYGPLASLCFSLPVFGQLLLHHHGHQQAQRIRANQEMAWLIWKRGSIQDEIMRARENEAMDRRLRRCRSTLLLSRGDAQDFNFLFGRLEKTLRNVSQDTDLAILLVGGIAAHLRHVFIERDQDDVTLFDACRHIARWADWLNSMGLENLEVKGTPDMHHESAAKKVPSMLFLGAAEQMGIAALADARNDHIEWQWVIEDTSVLLTANGGPNSPWSERSAQDWDTAFMLRHGGIAHAGGAWRYELPLLPA